MPNEQAALVDRFLAEINAALPQAVDWKKGAIDYLSNTIQAEGAASAIFHRLKPFLAGPDFRNFYEDMYKFLNLTQILHLPKGSAILDVGCGSGWLSQYLARLGYYVVGIDISSELLALAQARVASDLSPFPNHPLPVKFILHDIEAAPLAGEVLFDAAICESTLHHFLNPIQSLCNVAESLKAEGTLSVLEGFAPEPSSPAHAHLMEVMAKYQTLERPYSKEQFQKIFELSGFHHYKFLHPVSGFKEAGGAEGYSPFYVDGPAFNYIIASRSGRRLAHLGGGTSGRGEENPYHATLAVLDLPGKLSRQELRPVTVKVKNSSEALWQNYPETQMYVYNLAYHWLDGEGNPLLFDGLRTALPVPLAPGAEIEMQARVQAPAAPGEYLLEFDVVREQLSWFGEQGSPTVRIEVQVD